MSDDIRLAVLCGHASLPKALAFSPDRGLLASGDRGGWIHLWSLAPNARVLRIPDPPQQWRAGARGVDHLAFVSGGGRLAVDAGGLELWDVATGRRELAIPGLGGPFAVCDGRLWAVRRSLGTDDDRLVEIDPETGGQGAERAFPGLVTRRFLELHGGLGQVAQVRGALRVWDLDTGEPIATVPLAGAHDFARVALAPDGARAAVEITRGELAVVDLASGAFQPVLRSAWAWLWTPDGLVASGGAAILRFDDRGAPTVVEAGDAHALAPSGWGIVAGDHRGGLRLVGLAHEGLADVLFPTTRAAVVAVAFSPEAVISAHGDGVVRTWSLATGACARAVRRSPIVRDPVVALDPNGAFAASVTPDAVIVWDVATGAERLRVPGLFGERSRTITFGGGTFAVGAARLRAWEVRTGALRLDRPPTRSTRVLAVDRSGAWLAEGGQDGVTVVSIATGETFALAFAKDQHLAPASLAFSPDGRTLTAGGTDFSATTWDLASGARLTTVEASGDSLGVAVSPDGRIAAAQHYDASIWLHEPTRGRSRALRGHRGDGRAVAFSPDGRWLASGAEDGAVCLWNPVTGRRALTWQVLPRADGWVALTPDGAWIGSDGAERFLQCGGEVPAALPPRAPEAIARALHP